MVLEAQASGLPVIVTDQGGPRENMIHKQTGLVVPGDDLQALQEAMEVMVNHPESIRSMGSAARRYVEERSIEVAFLKTWDMYCEETTAASNPDLQAKAV